MSSEAKQPLLEGPSQPLLLEGPESSTGASHTAANGTAHRQSAEERLQEEEDAKYARGASRVVTYTVWFLLAAVMIGTIVGIIFVTIPMQQGSIPGPRKSAVLLVTAQDKTSNMLGFRKGAQIEDDKYVEAVVWSGKGRHMAVPFNDLYSFSLINTMWNEISSEVRTGDQDIAPIPRWKAVGLREEGKQSLVVHGGDPLASDGPADHYMDDTWRLDLSDKQNPVWTKLQTAFENGTDVKPSGRRAHVGVIFSVDGIPTMVIHGGRTKSGELLSDVWATPLDNITHLDWQLKRDLPPSYSLDLVTAENSTSDDDQEDSDDNSESDQGGNEVSKKHHKKASHNYPASRKGHLAVSVPDNPHAPLMIILGGRNDTNYFSDMWEYNLKANSWRRLEQYGRKLPTPRDHFGGFYDRGVIYIFGGRGSEDDEYISGQALNDMWAYTIETSEWKLLHPSGPSPIPRFLYSMDTYVSGDSSSAGDLRFVIMGGEGPKACYLNDLWEYSMSLNKWKQWGVLKTDPGKEKCADL